MDKTAKTPTNNVNTQKNKVSNVNKYIIIYTSHAISNQGLHSNKSVNKILLDKTHFPHRADTHQLEDTLYNARRIHNSATSTITRNWWDPTRKPFKFQLGHLEEQELKGSKRILTGWFNIFGLRRIHLGPRKIPHMAHKLGFP